MRLLEIARCGAFWLIDFLKGKKIKLALKTLYNCEDGIWSEQQISAYQEICIQKLLSHAKATVPYYAKQEDLNLKNWPVVNKNIFRANRDSVLSGMYEKKQLITMSTSGSTGTPFTCWQNNTKKRHVNAETLYYNGKVGFSVGKRIIYLRSVVSEIQKNKLKQFAQNIYLLDCNDLSDSAIKDKLRFIVDYSKRSGAMIIGYASTLTAFQKYFDKYGYDDVKEANIYGVVSSSEMLYDATRVSIEKAFNCKCVSRYANEENGFLGQDSNENNVFLMNRADYFVEILKLDSDEVANEGEVGRIVVTDLYNYAMPMIRYDTGDVGARVKVVHNGVERTAIGSFGGRIVDSVKDFNGNLVSPHAITNLMWKYKNIKQFQFVQKAKGKYKIILNAQKDDINESRLIRDYKEIFGQNSDFTISYCDDIPVLASGKRRYIINESID